MTWKIRNSKLKVNCQFNEWSTRLWFPYLSFALEFYLTVWIFLYFLNILRATKFMIILLWIPKLKTSVIFVLFCIINSIQNQCQGLVQRKLHYYLLVFCFQLFEKHKADLLKRLSTCGVTNEINKWKNEKAILMHHPEQQSSQPHFRRDVCLCLFLIFV